MPRLIRHSRPLYRLNLARSQESVQSKSKELDELEERLRQAEARKQELEAKGVKIP